MVTVRSVYHACTLTRERETRKDQTPEAVTVFANSRNGGDQSRVFRVPPLLKHMSFVTTRGN